MAFGTSPYGPSSYGSTGATAPTVPATSVFPEKELVAAFGRDLFFDTDYRVTDAGDWLIVEFEDALRQSMRRRIITTPGEWQTNPDYGVGARLFLKARRTPAMIDELRERIRSQMQADERIRSVEQVDIDTETIADGLKISVKVQPKGRADRVKPVLVSVEVT